jgi:hypothetical protein
MYNVKSAHMPSGNLYVSAQVQVQAGFGDDRFNEADDSELEYVDLKGVLTVKIVKGAGMACLPVSARRPRAPEESLHMMRCRMGLSRAAKCRDEAERRALEAPVHPGLQRYGRGGSLAGCHSLRRNVAAISTERDSRCSRRAVFSLMFVLGRVCLSCCREGAAAPGRARVRSDGIQDQVPGRRQPNVRPGMQCTRARQNYVLVPVVGVWGHGVTSI